MYFQLLFAVVFILESAVAEAVIVTADSKEDEPCTTPNGENATCVRFLKCRVIAAAVATFAPEALKFAQESKCGFVPGMVCCGSTAAANSTTGSSPLPQNDAILLKKDLSDLTLCGIDAIPSFRIKGGIVAQFKEFPWLAAIEYYSKYAKENAGIRCGGSLINDEYVLTAAHCIVHVEFEVIRVWLGVTNIGPKGNCLNHAGEIECINSTEKVHVIKALVHSRYKKAYGYNDIGLLQLGHTVTFTDYIRPICLPAQASPFPRAKTYFTVAGWGITESNNPSDIKLKVEVPLRNNSVCDKFLASDDTMVTPEQLCVGGERGKDSCQGDSGGPLMRSFVNENGQTQWYQEGVVSYGVGCGIAGRPAIYTRVSSYVKWMTGKIITLFPRFKDGGKCETPRGTLGKCVSLNYCQEVFNLAASKNSSVLSSPDEEFSCGYDDEPLFCCETPNPEVVPNFDTKAFPDKTVCGLVQNRTNGTNDSDTAEPGEFPWVVGVEYQVEEDSEDVEIKCSGALITNRFVLTLSECGFLSSGDPVSVWLGDWNTSTISGCNKTNTGCAAPVARVPIKQMLLYPANGFPDYMLLLLKNEIHFTDHITPICLPFPNKPSIASATHMAIAAWDNMLENDPHRKVLRKYSVVLKEGCDEEDTYKTVGESCWKFENGNYPSILAIPLTRLYEDGPSGRAQWYLEGVATINVSDEDVNAITYYRLINAMNWILNIISEAE